MGLYRVRDLGRVPSLLSLTRVPLGVAFALTVDRPALALSVIALSGLTDILDGWWARRFQQVTPMGAVVDPITDKWFVLCVVLALVSRGSLPWLGVLALSTREIGEAPLVVWVAFSHHARRARTETPMAMVPGKIATALQFVTITAALFRLAFVRELLIATAIVGVVAAVVYWRRAIVRTRESRASWNAKNAER